MGREVRRVPADWKHPKKRGEFVPLLGSWSNHLKSMEEHPDWYEGEEPTPREEYMPDFPEGTATHYMMYETCTEGTPLSPAFATPEELAQWLTDNGASAFGSQTGSYEGWLRVARGGFAPSAAFSPETGLISGVDAAL